MEDCDLRWRGESGREQGEEDESWDVHSVLESEKVETCVMKMLASRSVVRMLNWKNGAQRDYVYIYAILVR